MRGIYKSWEHKAYCLPTIFILAGIKAVFSTKSLQRGSGMKFPITSRIPEIFRCIVAVLRLALHSAVL